MITKRLRKKVVSTVNRTLIKKAITRFRPLILSRHPSHDILRTGLNLQPFRCAIRLGSETIPEGNNRRIQINTPQSVRNSASKLLMKQCFDRANVKHALWINGSNSRIAILNWADNTGYPIISKSLHGSRGNGNIKHDNRVSLERFLTNNSSGYIFEKYMSYSREYRLHIVENRCFYTCRKLLRNDAPIGTWQRHDDVVTWALETNISFKKPNNWDAIIADCVRAKNALGLDMCAFDVMMQGSRKGRIRNNPEWIICESCSAPSFGEITGQKYIQELNRLVIEKYNNR